MAQGKKAVLGMPSVQGVGLLLVVAAVLVVAAAAAAAAVAVLVWRRRRRRWVVAVLPVRDRYYGNRAVARHYLGDFAGSAEDSRSAIRADPTCVKSRSARSVWSECTHRNVPACV